jgi:hypothetical protein
VIIAVVDLAFAAIDNDFAATIQISWGVIFFRAERHAWAVGLNWLLGELLSLEEHWEGEPAAVRGVDFLDFNGLVA